MEAMTTRCDNYGFTLHILQAYRTFVLFSASYLHNSALAFYSRCNRIEHGTQNALALNSDIISFNFTRDSSARVICILVLTPSRHSAPGHNKRRRFRRSATDWKPAGWSTKVSFHDSMSHCVRGGSSDNSSQMLQKNVAVTKMGAVVKRDEVVFRGQETLEDTIKRYDEHINKMNEYVQTECKDQIAAMKKAQADLENKIKAVMTQDDMKRLEENAQREGDKMNTQMRRMQRELQRMEDDIYEDTSMDAHTREVKLNTLHKAAVSQYGRLSEKYPAAMRAQLLSNVRLLH